MTGYYDPARGADGNFCGGYPLSTDAWNWAENSILAPLNQTLGSVADAFHWHKVADFNAAPWNNSFLMHGYCSQNTWIRPMWSNDGDTSLPGAPWNAPDDA